MILTQPSVLDNLSRLVRFLLNKVLVCIQRLALDESLIGQIDFTTHELVVLVYSQRPQERVRGALS